MFHNPHLQEATPTTIETQTTTVSARQLNHRLPDRWHACEPKCDFSTPRVWQLQNTRTRFTANFHNLRSRLNSKLLVPLRMRPVYVLYLIVVVMLSRWSLGRHSNHDNTVIQVRSVYKDGKNCFWVSWFLYSSGVTIANRHTRFYSDPDMT